MTLIEELVTDTIKILNTQRIIKKPARILVLVKPERHADYLDQLVKALIKYLDLKEEYFPFVQPENRIHRINYEFLGYDYIDVVKSTQRGPIAIVTTSEQTHTLIDTGAE